MRRALDRSGIEASALGMGCWAIGGLFWAGETPLGWGEVNDEESVRAIHAALDRGVNFFDTANVYGAGHSERVLGRAIAGRRSDVVIATKFSTLFDETTRQVTGSDASPEGIRKACEESLRKRPRLSGRRWKRWCRQARSAPMAGVPISLIGRRPLLRDRNADRSNSSSMYWMTTRR